MAHAPVAQRADPARDSWRRKRRDTGLKPTGEAGPGRRRARRPTLGCAEPPRPRDAHALRPHAARSIGITTLVLPALFARLPYRRDAAPFSCARGRRRLRRPARAAGPNAINSAVVNERRPRPGGERPLIGRATAATLTGAAQHALAAAQLGAPQSRMWRSPRDDTTACEICVHLSVDIRDPVV